MSYFDILIGKLILEGFDTVLVNLKKMEISRYLKPLLEFKRPSINIQEILSYNQFDLACFVDPSGPLKYSIEKYLKMNPL